MTALAPITILFNGQRIICHGNAYAAKTFITFCENKLDDRDFTAVHPDKGRRFTSWAEVVRVLANQPHITPVREIHAHT